MKKEIKTFSFEIKEFTKDENFFYFEGYASTFGNIDYGNDVIVKGAFIASLAANPEVQLLWQHNMQKPIGASVELREDEKGLFIKGRISIRTTLGKDVAILLEDKVIKEMSIGYFTKVSEMKGEIRYLTELELFEVSVVTKAMNSQALIKSLEGSSEMKDVESILKDGGFSQKESKTIIAKIKEISRQRDAEEKKVQRDAEALELKIKNDKEVAEALNQFTNSIKLK